MIGTIYIKVNAENPNISAKTIYSFKDSPSSLRIIDVPKRIGKWEITRVYLNVTNPNGTLVVQDCVRTNGAYVVTFNGCSTLGKSSDGYKVLADGKDENGDSVQGYVLAVGDYIVLDGEATLTNDGVKHRMNLLESVPTTPSQGDVCLISNELKIYVGEEWKPFADVDLSGYATTSEVETISDSVTTLTEHIGVISGEVNELVGTTIPDIQESVDTIPTKSSKVNAGAFYNRIYVKEGQEIIANAGKGWYECDNHFITRFAGVGLNQLNITCDYGSNDRTGKVLVNTTKGTSVGVGQALTFDIGDTGRYFDGDEDWYVITIGQYSINDKIDTDVWVKGDYYDKNDIEDMLDRLSQRISALEG